MVSAKLKSGRAAVSGLPKDRQKAMDEALSQVEKQFGKGAIMRLHGSITSASHLLRKFRCGEREEKHASQEEQFDLQTF